MLILIKLLKAFLPSRNINSKKKRWKQNGWLNDFVFFFSMIHFIYLYIFHCFREIFNLWFAFKVNVKMAIKLVVYYNDRGESIWYWRCYEKVIIVGKKKIKLTFCTSHHIPSYMNYHKKKIQIQIKLFKVETEHCTLI